MDKILDKTASVAAGAKIAAFLALVVALVPVAVVYRRARPNDPYKVPRFFHSLLLKLTGIRLRVQGTPCADAPVFFVCNHVSYLDILVLGATLPASFVAKSEVSGWPLFGFLSRLQNTIFIERRSTRAAAQRTQLQRHLDQKQSLILFPEGTSSDGLRTLPFKSSLFSVVTDHADERPLKVQPISLVCTEYNGFPILRDEQHLYAWYGDMTLAPHLWDVFKRGDFTVDLIFHTPIATTECPDRKALAALCHARIAEGIEHARRARPRTAAPRTGAIT